MPYLLTLIIELEMFVTERYFIISQSALHTFKQRFEKTALHVQLGQKLTHRVC